MTRKRRNPAEIAKALPGENLDQVRADTQLRAVVWQLKREMDGLGISPATLAERIEASPVHIDQLLKASETVPLRTLQRAAAAVGRMVQLKLK